MHTFVARNTQGLAKLVLAGQQRATEFFPTITQCGAVNHRIGRRGRVGGRWRHHPVLVRYRHRTPDDLDQRANRRQIPRYTLARLALAVLMQPRGRSFRLQARLVQRFCYASNLGDGDGDVDESRQVALRDTNLGRGALFG